MSIADPLELVGACAYGGVEEEVVVDDEHSSACEIRIPIGNVLDRRRKFTGSGELSCPRRQFSIVNHQPYRTDGSLGFHLRANSAHRCGQVGGPIGELRSHGGRLPSWRPPGGRTQSRITYDVATGRRIVLLTVFAKTRPRERAEVERARRAMQRCIDEKHINDEER